MHSQAPEGHAHHSHPHAPSPAGSRGLDRLAFSATLHCLAGCAIGEVIGLVVGTALGWGDAATIALAVTLAFATGYLATMIPLRRSGMGWGPALRLALAADTASVAIMELVDNALMLLIPGAMRAPLDSGLFWGSMALALAAAGVAAYPVNRYLLARGRGHALVHGHHGGGGPGEAITVETSRPGSL